MSSEDPLRARLIEPDDTRPAEPVGGDRQRLGEVLAANSRIDRATLDRALRLQAESGERIGTILVKLGLLAESDLAQALSEQLNLPLVLPHEYPDAPLLDGVVSREFLLGSRIVPLAQTDARITVAMADPLDAFAASAIGLATGRTVDIRVGTASDIEAVCQRDSGEAPSSMTQIVEAINESDDVDVDDIQQLRDLASGAPIIRLVNLMIARAVRTRASDVHIEPFEHQLKVRYRIDGVLRDVDAPPPHSSAAIISRIKVMANLNIAERRLPQDGRIKVRIEGKELDLRVSTIPTMHGESTVMRLLDSDAVPLNLRSLGFSDAVMTPLDTMLARPHGIILVTGPTGSGKTTTLYAALQTLNTPDRKVLTVEDPVEYQLDGINQIQVKPQIGLTFAHALRSILRQDPDVIMVGEMRDLETAQIAVQSALTGHKVFSTLHTNDAASSVTRMLDMGIEDYLLTSTVNGILAQRLVRRLCDSCKRATTVLPELADELGLTRLAGAAGPITVYEQAGCDDCDGIGYRGRTAVLELLPMTDTMRRAVLAHADSSTLHETARAEGMVPMYDDGLVKALAGETTVDEVVRVTQEA